MFRTILKAFRFSENLTHLFFLLSRYKFLSTALAAILNFNEEKREKIKIRKPKCFDYIIIVSILFVIKTTALAQDSIPVPSQKDTSIISTIVIREPLVKIRQITRGVNLIYPPVSFKNTKALGKKFKRFRVPSFWERINKIGINLNEVAFVNWNAGGDNSVSAIGDARFVRNYKFSLIQWDNELQMRYGVNAQEGRKLRKSDDAIRFSSTFGYRKDTTTNWYYSAKLNFNTQFSNGFKYPDRETPISSFMSPGYTFLGAGTSYISKNQKFNLYISPITQKATHVLDQELANKGAFGVQKAILDAEGNVIQEGKNVLLEFGFLVTNNWETLISKNISIRHRFSLYSDYIADFGNIDLDWELNFTFVVNKYINANIGTHIIFDDNILFDEIKAADGTITNPGTTRIQFKQLLGIGLTYNF